MSTPRTKLACIDPNYLINSQEDEVQLEMNSIVYQLNINIKLQPTNPQTSNQQATHNRNKRRRTQTRPNSQSAKAETKHRAEHRRPEQRKRTKHRGHTSDASDIPAQSNPNPNPIPIPFRPKSMCAMYPSNNTSGESRRDRRLQRVIGPRAAALPQLKSVAGAIHRLQNSSGRRLALQ